MIELVDRRVLGGFVCVDAITGSPVVPAIPVTTPQWTVKPNRSGIYVIFNGPGFDLLTGQFIPTGTWPARSQPPIFAASRRSTRASGRTCDSSRPGGASRRIRPAASTALSVASRCHRAELGLNSRFRDAPWFNAISGIALGRSSGGEEQ